MNILMRRTWESRKFCVPLLPAIGTVSWAKPLSWRLAPEWLWSDFFLIYTLIPLWVTRRVACHQNWGSTFKNLKVHFCHCYQANKLRGKCRNTLGRNNNVELSLQYWAWFFFFSIADDAYLFCKEHASLTQRKMGQTRLSVLNFWKIQPWDVELLLL